MSGDAEMSPDGTAADGTMARRALMKKAVVGAAVTGAVWQAPKIKGLSLRPDYAAAASGAKVTTVQLLLGGDGQPGAEQFALPAGTYGADVVQISDFGGSHLVITRDTGNSNPATANCVITSVAVAQPAGSPYYFPQEAGAVTADVYTLDYPVAASDFSDDAGLDDGSFTGPDGGTATITFSCL